MAKKISLLILDFIVLYLSLLLTLIARYGGRFSNNVWEQHFWPFFFIYLGWLVVFFIFNLYDLAYKKNLELFTNIFKSVFIGAIITAIFFYLAPPKITNLKPQLTLFINFFIAIISIYLTRRLFQNFIKIPGLTYNTLILGFNEAAKKIAQALASQKFYGYNLIGIYDNQSSEVRTFTDNIKIFNRESINQLLKNKSINTIVNTLDLKNDHNLINTLFNGLSLKIKFYNYPIFYERLFNKIPVNEVSQLWFLENMTENKKLFYEFVKRILDIIISVMLSILSLPLIPLIILIIKVDSPGPIFFTQVRIGKNGRVFKAIKFRSMSLDAEKSGPQWAQKNDPRITHFGKLLRKTRIDEIPQLFNILKSEMSLVGPRPERPEFVEELTKAIPFYKERLLVKPGLTGWAQIIGPAYGGSTEETLEKLQYDLFYIKNRSLFFDLGIILKTINIILKRQGR